MYLLFLIWACRYLTEWLRTFRTRPLVLSSVMLALGYLTRYEMAAAAFVAMVTVTARDVLAGASARAAARRRLALADTIVFVVPLRRRVPRMGDRQLCDQGRGVHSAGRQRGQRAADQDRRWNLGTRPRRDLAAGVRGRAAPGLRTAAPHSVRLGGRQILDQARSPGACCDALCRSARIHLRRVRHRRPVPVVPLLHPCASGLIDAHRDPPPSSGSGRESSRPRLGGSAGNRDRPGDRARGCRNDVLGDVGSLSRHDRTRQLGVDRRRWPTELSRPR